MVSTEKDILGREADLGLEMMSAICPPEAES